MKAKYSIDTNSEALIFTGKPKQLKSSSIRTDDKNKFKSVVIPNSVSSVEYEAFYGCFSLASVHIPSSAASILGWAFFGCSALASIHIPNSVATIHSYTFNSCAALASIHIPNSVLTIEQQAFYTCSHLHKACVHAKAKVKIADEYVSFQTQTALLRPRLKPIRSLQKKSACRVTEHPYSIYL